MRTVTVDPPALPSLPCWLSDAHRHRYEHAHRALTKPGGSSARLVRMWKEGRIEAVSSEATIREAELVLGGGWLTRMVSREAVDSLLSRLRSETVFIERPGRIADLRLKDEGDLRLVEAAVAAGARYIVTTDREFLRARGYGPVELVTPEKFLNAQSGASDTKL